MANYDLAYGDPIGHALDAGMKAYELGTAIRRQPEQEQQQRDMYAAQKLAEQRSAELQKYQLLDKQREEASAQAQRDFAYQSNNLKLKYGEGGPLAGQPYAQEDVDSTLRAAFKAGIPPHIGTPQFKSDVGTILDAAQGNGAHYRSPEFIDAANRLYAPSVNAGAVQNPELAQQKITDVVPGKGGTMHFNLANTKTDGSTYEAPLTLGRTGDDHDPIKSVSAADGVNHTVALAQVDQHINDNPALQKAFAYVQAMSPKDQHEYMLKLLRSESFSASGRQVPEAGDIVTGPDGKAMVSANGYFVYDKDLKPQHVETLHGGAESDLDAAKKMVEAGVAKTIPEAYRIMKDKGNPNIIIPAAAQPKYQPFQDKEGNLWNFDSRSGQYTKAGAPGGATPTGLTKVGGAGGSGGSLLTPDAIAVGAQVIRSTGKPPEGMSRNKADMAALYNAAAQSAIGEGKTAEAEALLRTANKSKQAAMSDMQKRNAAMEGAANTAENNFKTIEQYAAKVDRTGSPIINRLKQAWQTNVWQDPDLAKLKNALSETATEYAKVVTGQTTGAAVSDHANQQMQKLIAASDSPAAFAAELSAMRDMIKNRRSGYQQEIQSLQDSLHPGTVESGGGGGTKDNPTPVKTKAERDALPSGTYYTGPDGHVSLKP